MACKQLATINFSDAIANADSHEYFAENDPHIDIPYTISLNDIFRRNNITRPVSVRNLAQTRELVPPISVLMLANILA
jgi:hypothetical protein